MNRCGDSHAGDDGDRDDDRNDDGDDDMDDIQPKYLRRIYLDFCHHHHYVVDDKVCRL